MRIGFHRDEAGHPHAQAPAPHQAVGWWLEEDVQSNPDFCRELLGHVDALKNGQESDWSITGNAYTLTLKPGSARIDSEFAEPPVSAELSLDELRKAVSGWLDLIERRR